MKQSFIGCLFIRIIKFKPLGMLCFSALYFAQANYLYRAYRNSPLDRLSWLFLVVVVVAALLRMRTLKSWVETPQQRATRPRYRLLLRYLIALAGVGCFLLGCVYRIHFLQLAGSFILIAGGGLLLYGPHLFSGILPLLGIAFFSLPSVTFQLGEQFTKWNLDFGLSPRWAEWGITILLLLWFFHRDTPLSWRRLVFPTALGTVLLMIAVKMQTQPVGDALFLPQNILKCGDFLGIEQELNDMDRRFFQTEEVSKYQYFDDQGGIFLLSVEIQSDIHSIHPAELCLRSAGFPVEHSQERLLPLPGIGTLSLREIVFQNRGKPYLAYAWYVSEEFSTGNFVLFRRSFSPRQRWCSYQLSTELDAQGNIASGRARMNALLLALYQNR